MNMKKKITLCLFGILMCLTMMAQVDPVKPSLGDGTEENPYQVSTLAEFMWMGGSSMSGKYFVLTNDIDLSPACSEASGTSWKLFGSGSYRHWRGTLDGKGHSVKNLYQKDTYNGGLFYNIDGTVKNLNLDNVYVESNVGCGALSAFATSARIENCSVTGNVTGNNISFAGGIVGEAQGLKVIKCTNKATVKGSQNVGGIVAICTQSVTFDRCLNEGDVSGQASVGGICGENTLPAYFYGCENRGNITATGSHVGGISGVDTSYGHFENCCNRGNVTGSDDVGGIFAKGVRKPVSCINYGDVFVNLKNGFYGLIGPGSSNAASDINSNFYSSECIIIKNGQVVSSTGGISNCTSVTPEQLKSGEVAYYLQNRRDTLFWKQQLGVDEQPVLNFDYASTAYRVVKPDTIDCRGVSVGKGIYRNGTEYNCVNLDHVYVDDFCEVCYKTIEPEFVGGVYRIKSSGNLLWFADAINSGSSDLKTTNAELTADIDMTMICKYLTNGWESIGNGTKMFTGTFDGKGHSVQNLTYNNSSNTEHNGGLFGNLYNATIQNLKLSATSTCAAGGLLAYTANKSQITNCHIDGKLTCKSDGAGGLVGSAAISTFNYCSSKANVTGNSKVGGIIGNSTSSNTLTYCASYGACNGVDLVGLIGSKNGDALTNCVYYSDGAKKFEGYYINKDGVKVVQTKTEMNEGATVIALNDPRWGQNVGTDLAPVLGADMVYKHYYKNCKNEYIKEDFAIYYTNDDQEERTWNEDGHLIKNYSCQFCGAMTPHEDGYYHIASVENLEWFRDEVNSGNLKDVKAMLDNSIDLSKKYNKNASWVPIGYTKETPFTGEFEGNLHFIWGLYINTDMRQADYWGLFGYVGVPTGTSNTVIKNVMLDEAVVKSNKEYTGFIAGYVREATIQRCRVQGANNYSTLETDKDYAGGIVGYLYSGTVYACVVTQSNIQSTAKNVGFMAGFQNSGTIRQCSVFTSKLSTTSNYVGGIVGYARQSTIQDCRIYNTEIEGASYVGGLCGYLANATLERSYSQAEVKATASTYNHAVVGQVSHSETSKLYYSTTHTSLTDTKAEGLTDSMFECGKVAYLLGEPWGQNLVKGEKRPLANSPGSTAVYCFDYTSEGGCMCYTNDPEGGESSHSYANGYCVFCGAEQTLVKDTDGIYYISNAAHLKQFRDIVNHGEWDANAKLVNDIDMSPICSSTVGSWEPIGTTNWSDGYEGTFDGDGYSITGLYINSHDYYTGLFGVARNGSSYHGATIKNLTVEGDVTSSQGYCAIIAGMTQGGTITNCVARGKVSTSNGYTIAGICANAWESTIADCTNEASISATITSYNVGGIVGESTSDITGCTNTGNISIPGKAKQVGGIVGSTTANIARCINKGTINNPDQESEKTGGIVGETSGSITHCANEGDVTAHILVGGIAGRAENCNELSHNYNVGKVTANSNSVVGSLFGSAFGSSNIINNVYLSNGTFDTHGVPATEDEFRWGKAAYLLGGDWGQDISYDQKYPSLDGKKVYEHSKNLPDWKSDNKGKQGTRSEYEWEIDVDKYAFVCIDFDWTVNCDPDNYLWIHAGDEDNLVQGVSGEKSGHETYSQMESDVFHFSAIYRENYVNDDYEDEATITNMQVKWYSNNEDKFVILSGLAGDIDGDGKLTIRDIALMIAIMNGNSSVQVGNPDIDGDGNVTMNDLELLKQSVIAIGE